LVEVESIQIEGHSRDTKSGKPNANNRPSCKEKVEGARIVKRSILKDKTPEIAVRRNNVVCLFFLSKLVAIVLGLSVSVVSRTSEDVTREPCIALNRDPPNTPATPKHMERVHEDVMLGLENQHVVEGSRYTQRHSVRKRSLSEGIDKKYSGRCSDGGRVCDTNPGPHS
jgi:hypothetical protein